MDIEGTIIFDLPMQEGTSKSTGNRWVKKEWVLETLGPYPRKVKFTVFGERRVNDLKFEMGKAYRVSVDAESREYNNRWYTDLMAYACTPIEGGMPAMGNEGLPPMTSEPPTTFGQPAAPIDPFDGSTNETDDLPF